MVEVQEVEALSPVAEAHDPGLVGMQPQPKRSPAEVDAIVHTDVGLLPPVAAGPSARVDICCEGRCPVDTVRSVDVRRRQLDSSRSGDVTASLAVVADIFWGEAAGVDALLDAGGVLAPGGPAGLVLWDRSESAGEVFGRVGCEALDSAVEGAVEGVADHGAGSGEGLALIGGGLQGGPAAVLVPGELFDLGAQADLGGCGGTDAAQSGVHISLCCGRLGGPCPPAAGGGSLQPLTGTGEVLAGLVAVADLPTEIPASLGQVVAPVNWDLPVELPEAVGVVGQAVAEDADAVGERVVRIGAGDSDVSPVLIKPALEADKVVLTPAFGVVEGVPVGLDNLRPPKHGLSVGDRAAGGLDPLLGGFELTVNDAPLGATRP